MVSFSPLVFLFSGRRCSGSAATEVAAPTATEAPATEAAAPAEFAGVLEVTPVEGAAATIVLKVADKSYKLEVAAEKVAEVEALNGKNVTVKGTMVPAAEGQTMDTIQVAEFAEAVAAPAATETPAAE